MDGEEPAATAGSFPTGDPADVGGDPACWAALLCPNCGAVPDGPLGLERRCARCGGEFPAE